LPALIESTLTTGNLGIYGISAGILQQDGSFPNLKPLREELESYKLGKQAMIIIIGSFKDCKNLLVAELYH